MTPSDHARSTFESWNSFSFIQDGVTYSFLGPENLSSHYPNSETFLDVGGLNGDAQNYVLGASAYNLLDSYFGVSLQATSAAFGQFLEIAGISAQETDLAAADINIVGDNQTLYIPGPWGSLVQGTPYGVTHTDGAGQPDIWLFQPGVSNPSNMYWTLYHELGHALGLGEAQGLVSSQKYSIMSYDVHEDSGQRVFEFQLNDIAALQYLYGASSWEGGNTTYVYADFQESHLGISGATRARHFSLWDSGGVDKIDLSVSPDQVYVDLRPGYFSSAGPNSGVNLSDAGEIINIGIQNASIAFGSYIEQADGSSNNDILVGNLLSNVLHGNAGNDLMFAEGASVARYQGPLGGINGMLEEDDGDYSVITKGDVVSQSLSPQQQLDVLLAGDGDDQLYGGRGTDHLYGEDGNDKLHGDDGNDLLDGGDGVDLIEGNTGSDRLTGGKGNDKNDGSFEGGLFGGSGDDLLIAEVNDGDDDMQGGEGTDTIVYKYAQGNAKIKVVEGAWFSGQTAADFGICITGAQDETGASGTFGNDALASIEKAAVEAGSGTDTLRIDGKSYYGYINYIDLGGQGAGFSNLDKVDASFSTTSITIDLRESSNQTLTVNDGFFTDSTLKLRNAENVIGSNYDDKIYGVNGSTGSSISGGAGKDEIYGGDHADVLEGGSGDDIIVGGDGADTLDGGDAADSGPDGADVLVIDGLDTIARGDVEDRLYWKSYDAVTPTINQFRGGVRMVVVNDEQTRDQQIQEMLNSQDLYKGAMGETYEVTGTDESQGLIITMKSGDVVNLAQWQEGEYNIFLQTTKRRTVQPPIVNFGVAGTVGSLMSIGTLATFTIGPVLFMAEFAHDPNWLNFVGDQFTLTQLRTWAGQPGLPPRSNNIEGTSSGETINGRMGNDRILGWAGSDNLNGSAGDDFIDGGDGADFLNGGIGADRLEGGAGDDTFEGGAGDDVIVTGGGKDLIIIRAGDGADVVMADTQDVIRFEGLNSTDVTARTSGAGSAPQYGATIAGNISFSFGADTVTIQGGSFGSVEFADGVVQTAAVLARNAITSATSAGDDVIVGFGTADRLAGGAGNDYLNGLGGNDRYYFAIGDGQDRIEDSAGFADRIIFGPGITPADIVVTTSQIESGTRANAVLARFAIAGTSDWVEFVVSDIEEIRFADGTSWKKDDIGSRVYQALGTAGDDNIQVVRTIDGVFRPGAGNDTITAGQYATAQVQFGFGSQLDRIELSNDGLFGAGRALITLDPDISVGDLSIQRLGDGLSFTIHGTTDRLEVARYYDSAIQSNWRTFDISLSVSGITLSAPTLERIADVDAGVVQHLYGTMAGDTLVGLAGGDWISGGAGNDTISGNDGADLLFGGAGNDQLNGGAGGDILIGEAGDDLLDGGTGNDLLFSGTGADTLIGGEGNDELTGNGQSFLNGGVGNDRIFSSPGDTIVYNLGDGTDTVTHVNGESTHDGSTIVKRTEVALGTGISATSTTLTLEGYSVYININGSATERIHLAGLFQSPNMPQIRFADGTIWRETDILEKLFAPNNGDATANGMVSQVPNSSRTLAYVYGGGGNDTLSDQSTPVRNASELRYVFAPGSGNDVISGIGRTGQLVLYGFDPDQMSVARSGTGLGDFTLSFAGSTDAIKINGQQKSNGGSVITDLIFSGAHFIYGSEYLRERYLAQITTSGNDTITGFDGPGGVQDNGVIPGQIFAQNPGNDRLQGGLGNDLMIGGSGDDTYVINIGDGIDIIRDISLFNSGAAAGYDVLLTNALSTNAIFQRSTSDAKDLIITFSNSADQIAIDEFYALGTIEEFEFGDGVVLSALDVEQRALTGSATSGNDAIKGSASPETLTGNAGNDSLDGLGGSDRYLFNLGDGQDVVTDTGTAESNTLAFGAGITLDQVTFQKIGNNLKAVVNANDSLTITGQYSGSAIRPIGQVVFANGTHLSALELDQIVLAQMATAGHDTIAGFTSNDTLSGGAGNDTLNGGAGNDVLSGGTGNDTLNGQLGIDTYLIARGDGIDVIASTGDATAVDIVRFAEGISVSDLAFTRPTPTSLDLVVSFRDSSQSVTIANYFNGLAIKQFEFADGTVLVGTDVTAALADGAPVATAQTWRMTAIEGGTTRIVLPDGLFTDDSTADQLVYKATMADGSVLPAWLTFNGHVFETSADDAQVGTFAVKLTAMDRFGGSFDRVILLDVLNRNEAPTATVNVAVQSAAIGQSFSYALQSNLFTDQDQLFTATPELIAGTYATEHGGTFTVQANGAYNYAPLGSYGGTDKVYLPFDVGTAQALQLGYDFTSTGSSSAGSIPAGLVPAKDALTLTARLADGSPLPSWLTFDGTSFSGTPGAGDAGPLSIEIVATDLTGRAAVAPFAIKVGTNNNTPTGGSLPVLNAVQGEAFSYTLPASAFSDADAHDRLTITATLTDGSPLPSWLTFDGSALVGTPANGNVGAISVRFTATDIYGTAASITTGLTVQNVNDLPVVGASISHQIATQGQAFSFAVPLSSFADPDSGDTLTLSATLDTGEPLPAWLTFVNGMFSGTPADTDTGLVRLRVAATDQAGATVHQNFVLGIIDVDDAPVAAETLNPISAAVGKSTVFRIPSSLFADSDDDGYRLSVTLADGSALPTWIVYNPNSDTISFNPSLSSIYGKDSNAAVIDLKITATDARGASVSTTLTATLVAPVVTSTITGSGSIFGTYQSERIVSGSGNDAIYGGGGVDRIVFGRGSGQDSLRRNNEDSPYPLGDIVEFGADITLADLEFIPINGIKMYDPFGSDLLIKINGTTDQIQIRDQFNGLRNEEPTVREFVFADGSRLSAAQVQAMFAVSTSGDDFIRGGNQPDILNGGDGNDTINGFDGDDTIDGGAGDDRLVGDAGNAGGADTFLFGRGSGNDIVFADNSGTYQGFWEPFPDIDTLRFGPNITPADLIVTHTPGYPSESQTLSGEAAGSLLIQIAGTSDSITIDHQFYIRYFYQGQSNTLGIERFEFADGTVMNRTQFESLITLAPTTNGDDIIAGGAGADLLIGGAGNDILVGEEGADIYVYNPGDGDDRIKETMQESRATPSATATLRAGDIVSTDAISFGAGISPEDIVFTRFGMDGEDLVISFRNEPGSITIEGQFRNIRHGANELGLLNVTSYYGTENAAIDEFRFADGTRWFLSDIYAFSMKATADDDLIEGFFRSSETLDGGAGNDLLVGRNGDDTYVFARGYGNDMIKEFGWFYSDGTTGSPVYTANDKIKFVGVASTEVTSSIGAGGSFIFTINDTGETLTIRPESEFKNFTSIIFTDTTWTSAQFQTRWTVAAATAGNDVINGFVGNDTINGGDGNDTLQGGQNSGTSQTGLGYDVLNGGNGNDTLILESSDNDIANGDDGDDTFRIAMTLPYWTDQNLAKVDPDRGRLDYPSFVAYGTERGIIDGGAGSDTLILGGKLADYWMGSAYVYNNGDGSYSFKGGLRVSNTETVQFADGTLAFASIVAATVPFRPGVIEGTSGNDVMNGTSGNDALYGLAGNDTLNGLDGDDFLIGGDGTDSYNGGNGTDIVEYSHDSAGWIINLSTGQATQSGITETLVSIEGAYGSSAADTITGSANADILGGGGGDDIIAAGDGNDTIDFEGSATGFDAIDGGIGTDVIRAIASDTVIGLASLTGVEAITANGFSNVSIQGSAAANTLDFSAVTISGISTIDGGAGNDTITGTSAADNIVGGSGDDALNGGQGNDVFTMSGTSDGYDSVNGGAGNDVIRANGSSTRIGLSAITDVEVISANGNSSVYIQGSTAANALNFTNVVLDGIDRIDGGSGNDTIYGSAGADVILGSAGDDSLYGGLGDDEFRYSGSSNGFDLVDGGSGANRITAIANSTTIGLSGLSGVQSISAGSYTGVSIAGSANADALDFAAVALSGISKIDAGAGNDVIVGSSANDIILGSGGNDTLAGGDGNDIFQYTGSSSGFDALDGGSGNDTIAALAANTVIGLTSVTGVETITSGGFTGVTLAGSSTGDTLNFAGVTLTGITKIDGGAGNDLITGSAGADVLFGSADNDSLIGGDGDDALNGGVGTNLLDGGAGTDVAHYSGAAATYSVVSNGDGTYRLTGTGIDDTLANIENLNFSDGTVTVASRVGLGVTVSGTTSGETLIGSEFADTITGLGGDDTLIGNGGNDLFRVTGSSDGFDSIDGGAGSDTITATANNAVVGLASIAGIEAITAGGFTGVSIVGSSGANVLNFASVTLTSITKIDGGAGNDTITGSAAADTILGSGGDDTIVGGNGNDTFQFTGTANGFDAINGGSGTDTISALANSTIIGLASVAGVETITAGSFTGVKIAGSANADTLDFSSVTLTNITRIEAGNGNDIITGNSLANTIWGGLGDDIIDGGAGNDSLLGDDGDDLLKAGAGNDTINGGAGTDTLDYSAYTANLTVNLATTTAQTVTTGDSDTITNFENLTGGSGTDTLAGSTAANILNGGGGNDRLTGGTGNDTIIGGAGTSDVAVFAGTQASYTIATNAGVVTITDNQTTTDGNDGVDTVSGIEKVEFKGGIQVGITSPIVLDLNGDGVTLLDNRKTNAAFDWDGDGRKDQTGWVGRDDGFLMLDRDGNGKVSDATELSFTSDKPGAASDLDGLRAFDSNGDGILSTDDEKFGQFRVWRDRNGNGRDDRGEVITLADAGIAALNLEGAAVNKSWAWGENITINTGSLTRADGSVGSFSDVALGYTVTKKASAAPVVSAQQSAIQMAAARFSEAIAGYGGDGGASDLSLHQDWMDRGAHLFAAGRQIFR